MALADFPFRSQFEAGYFAKFQRAGLATARYLDRGINYGFDVLGLFEGTGLEPLLTTPGGYNAELIRHFYCNLVPGGGPVARSYVHGREVEFSVDQIAAIFQVPGNDAPDLQSALDIEEGGGWPVVNMELAGVATPAHDTDAQRLPRVPYVIQFVVRHCLFVKAGDKAHINSTLALVTFFCLRRQRFNVAGAIMQVIQGLADVRTQRQPPNLAHGHLIQVILHHLYGIFPPQGNDTVVAPFQRKSFTFILHMFREDGVRQRGGAAEVAAEAEAEPQQQPRREARAESGGSGSGRGRRDGQGGASPQQSAHSEARLSNMEDHVRQMGRSGFEPEDMRRLLSEVRRIRRSHEHNGRALDRVEREIALYNQFWCDSRGIPNPLADVGPSGPAGGEGDDGDDGGDS